MSGSEKGSLLKEDLVALLKGTTTRNLRKTPLRWLLAACFAPQLGIDHGISGDELLATLRKGEFKSHKAPKGDVTTIKMLLRTPLGPDGELMDALDEYVICESLMHRRATLYMELIAHRVMGEASTDPAYTAPLWDRSEPLTGLQQHMVDGLCAERSHYGLLEQLVLPEYHYHRGHHDLDPLLKDVIENDEQHVQHYSAQIRERYLHVMRKRGDEASTSTDEGPAARTRSKRRRYTSHAGGAEASGHEGRESGWVNARYYIANQLQQNLEVHVQSGLLSRVEDYLQSVRLDGRDARVWGSQEGRQRLFKMVVDGNMVDNMSTPLKTCLQDLRATLQPAVPHFTGPLPRRVRRPSKELLPLHLFLTQHSRPPNPNQPQKPCAPPPDEDDKPQDTEHVAAATGVDEKLAFLQGKKNYTAPTQASTRSFFPVAHLKRHSAPLDGNILAHLAPKKRFDDARAAVAPRKGRLPSITDLPLVDLLPELSAHRLTQRWKEKQNMRRQKNGKGKLRRRLGGGSVAPYLVPHFARTDGVSLCVTFRHILTHPDQLPSDEDLLVEHEQRVLAFDLECWRNGLMEEEVSSSSLSSGMGVGGSASSSRGRHHDTRHSRVEYDSTGSMLVNVPRGEDAGLLREEPVMGGGDVGGANLWLFGVRPVQPENLQPQEKPQGYLMHVRGTQPAAASSPGPQSSPAQALSPVQPNPGPQSMASVTNAAHAPPGTSCSSSAPAHAILPPSHPHSPPAPPSHFLPNALPVVSAGAATRGCG
mmetsp:Transcript_10549/g.28849  ORF Transcript_10549/g.28849 Transcript_10549/m.28849 type:complete len:761 (-) Transcript_10549:4853-7135(-)